MGTSIIWLRSLRQSSTPPIGPSVVSATMRSIRSSARADTASLLSRRDAVLQAVCAQRSLQEAPSGLVTFGDEHSGCAPLCGEGRDRAPERPRKRIRAPEHRTHLLGSVRGRWRTVPLRGTLGDRRNDSLRGHARHRDHRGFARRRDGDPRSSGRALHDRGRAARRSAHDACRHRGCGVRVLNLPSGARTSTLESKTNFLRAVTSGRATARCAPVHVGRSTIVLQTQVRDETTSSSSSRRKRRRC